MPTTGDLPARRTGSHLCYARPHPEVSQDHELRLREILRRDQADPRPPHQEGGAVVAPEAAPRRRAPRHRPLPGLQRAPHLAHGPDGHRHLRPARPGLRGRRRPDVLLRHPAPPPRPGGLGRALRQPHGRAAPEDGAARGGHVVPVVHPVLRRGAARPSCRSPSATPPSFSPTAWTAASSRSPSPSRPPSRCTITARASPGSARGWRRAGSSPPSRASRSWSSSPTCAGAGPARRR